MMRRQAGTVLFLLTGLGLVLAGLSGCGPEAQQAPPPPLVKVATPDKQDVTAYYHYTGTLEPVEAVAVRARVSGYLREVHFTPSSDVAAGDLLFTIEREPYEIALELADAEVERAIALRLGASTRYDKIKTAFDANAATRAELIEAEAQLKQRIAEVKSAQANQQEARLQLSYTKVTAPIAGRVSRSLVDAGNLVGSGEPTLLTTVVKMDPIFVYFDVSERIVLEYIGRGKKGSLGSAPQQPPVEIARPSDPAGTYPYRGTINWVDNQVDPQTGTIRVRGQLSNERSDLFPGLFVRARAPYHVIRDAVVIQQNAIGKDIGGSFVLVVDEKNSVARRAVTLGPQAGVGRVAVTDGLTHDDRYIVQGIQKARPGNPVTPQPSESQAKPAPVAPSKPGTDTAPTDDHGGE